MSGAGTRLPLELSMRQLTVPWDWPRASAEAEAAGSCSLPPTRSLGRPPSPPGGHPAAGCPGGKSQVSLLAPSQRTPALRIPPKLGLLFMCSPNQEGTQDEAAFPSARHGWRVRQSDRAVPVLSALTPDLSPPFARSLEVLLHRAEKQNHSSSCFRGLLLRRRWGRREITHHGSSGASGYRRA